MFVTMKVHMPGECLEEYIYMLTIMHDGIMGCLLSSFSLPAFSYGSQCLCIIFIINLLKKENILRNSSSVSPLKTKQGERY